MSNTSTSEISTSAVCANCGKDGSDVTNSCNKCKSVKYCNAACKKRHRHKHKKECERRVADYMMKNYSNNRRPKKRIVRFVSYVCQHYIRDVDISRVVER